MKMAEDNAPETEVVTPKPRAPRKRATPVAKPTPEVANVPEASEVKPAPKPRKPRKTAAQKAAEAAEAERLAAEKEAEAERPLDEDVVAPIEPAVIPAPPVENSTEPLVEESPVVTEPPVVNEVEDKEENEHDGIDELKAMFDEVDPDPEPEPVVHPLSVRGVVLAPGYWQGFEGPYGRLNVFAWLGFIFAFAFFPLGFIFSLLGLANAKAVPTDKFGKAIAWIGLAVSGIAGFVTLLWLIFLPFSLLFGGPVAHPLY
jgi:hypothetical protein